MFYEEIQIDGVWYWRNTPTGPWMPMASVRLTEKIATLQSQVDALRADAERWRAFSTTMLYMVDDNWTSEELTNYVDCRRTPATGEKS